MDNETKHTPEQWIAFRDTEPLTEGAETWFVERMESGSEEDWIDRQIAIVHTQDAARLIAAAPDLLEALQWCLNAMNHAYGGAANFAVMERDKARAAIAKAKGPDDAKSNEICEGRR